MEGVLYSKAYLAVLLFAALLGIPVSLLAFAFLTAVHELEHLVWETLPQALGYDTVPPWWPLAALGLAGLLVALTVTHLPGRGGHVPAHGLGTGPTAARDLPGTLLAAAASLVLGAVVGPEAPLIALGSGLAVLAVTRVNATSTATVTSVLSAAGSAAAISAVFGNPVVAAILFLEVLGLARRRTMMVVLPCLVSCGVGAVVFTGLGGWTGLEIGSLRVPGLTASHLDVAAVLWTLPLAVGVAVAMRAVFAIGRRAAELASSRPVAVTIVAGMLAGASAAVYAVGTGHSPGEVARSGQATLADLAAEPAQWSTGALTMLLVCKGIAFALCLGAFRGGPVFPAVFLGTATGTLAGTVLPALAPMSGLAIGMAAAVTVTRLPVTSVVLVVLLLGPAAANQMPVVILAAVAAFVAHEIPLRRARADA